MPSPWERHHHWLYHVSVLVCLSNEHACQSSEVECRGLLSRSGMCESPVRTFINNLTVTSSSVPGCRWLLQGLEKARYIGKNEFKVGQIQGHGPEEGKTVWQAPLLFGRSPNAIGVWKSLWRDWGRSSSAPWETLQVYKLVGCLQVVQSTCRKLKSAVDESRLPAKFKAWIYQHQYHISILPRLLWPLLIYEVPITIMEGFERNISQRGATL